MAGLMTWFQVTCPQCSGALQVRLPEGVTSVQCSQCKAVFAVQVQPVALMPGAAGSAPPAKRSRKRKKDSIGNDPAGNFSSNGPQPPRALSAYNVFMKSEVAKVKGEHPSLAHREAFKLAAERWQASPMNPQNGGDRFPLKADGDGAGSDAMAAQMVMAAADAGVDLVGDELGVMEEAGLGNLGAADEAAAAGEEGAEDEEGDYDSQE